MLARISSWWRRPFRFTLYACIQFVVLNSAAMLTYPGGTHRDPSSQGYSFFRNFFSSLGSIEAPNGELNVTSYMLFTVLLAGYIYLMTQGPDMRTAQGELVQVTGQKVISYAAIIIMGVQSYGAMRLLESIQELSTGKMGAYYGAYELFDLWGRNG